MLGPRTIAITRADDPRIGDYVRLTDVNLRRKLETERGLYLAESEPVLLRALAAGHVPRSVLVAESRRGALERIPNAHDVQCFVLSDDLAAQVTGFDIHRGVIGAMNRPEPPPVTDVIAQARRVVVLEDLTNHTNVGAIFRSVAALGADAVLVTPRCADPLYRRSVRVSMGAVFQIPWTRVERWPAAIDILRAQGFVVAGFDPGERGVSLDAFAADPPERVAMIFGTEMAGIDTRTLARCDAQVAIPMADPVSSLNVAAASAVAMWALR